MMNENIHLNQFSNSSELAQSLAHKIATNLKDAISKNGKASLIVSGGSTPKIVFETLKNIDLGWKSVTVGLCDERWVESTHKDSNEKFIKETLLQSFASKAKFVGMHQTKYQANEAQEICSQNIKNQFDNFDVLILGMGNDGHTASLFPNNPKLNEAYQTQNLCIAIKPSTAPHERMSLTLSAILTASNIYLHFEGDEKQKVFNEALDGENIYDIPIRTILNQNQKIVEVYCV